MAMFFSLILNMVLEMVAANDSSVQRIPMISDHRTVAKNVSAF